MISFWVCCVLCAVARATLAGECARAFEFEDERTESATKMCWVHDQCEHSCAGRRDGELGARHEADADCHATHHSDL